MLFVHASFICLGYAGWDGRGREGRREREESRCCEARKEHAVAVGHGDRIESYVLPNMTYAPTINSFISIFHHNQTGYLLPPGLVRALCALCLPLRERQRLALHWLFFCLQLLELLQRYVLCPTISPVKILIPPLCLSIGEDLSLHLVCPFIKIGKAAPLCIVAFLCSPPSLPRPFTHPPPTHPTTETP